MKLTIITTILPLNMIAYTLKSVLELVPEAMPFVKKASVEQEYPLDNKDACMASALCIAYHENIDHQSVDPWLMEKVANALELYGIKDEYLSLKEKMAQRNVFTKVASGINLQATYLTKQSSFEGDRSGWNDPEALCKTASALYDEAITLGETPSEDVSRYSGHAYLSKEAAVNGLTARFQATSNPVFVKLAVAIGERDLFPTKTVQDLCKTVTGLDKEANLHLKGFDFYKEALIVKQAAFTGSVRVRVGKEEFPLETILRISDSHLSHYIGPDFAKELKSDPANAKAVVETLPLDLQQVLLTLIKNA